MSVELLSFLSKYAVNMKASAFPILTARRRERRTTDLEVIMLGDSHGWGQGSPGYDVILPTYSSHMAVPYSKGFFAGLREHIIRKYGFYSTSIAPVIGDHANNLNAINGIFKETEWDVSASVSAEGFYAPRRVDRKAKEHLGYLAFNNKFNEKLLIIAPDQNGSALCVVDMTAHASKVYLGVIAGKSGAKLEVYFQQEDVGKGNTAGYMYRQAQGYPEVTRVENGTHSAVSSEEAVVRESENVVINTFKRSEDQEIVYCIDYGQKQRGKLCIQYNGADSEAVALEHPAISSREPVLRLRGIVFDSNDARNFSMGGHTIGQWLGDGTSSFNDPAYPHMNELLRFVPFTPSFAIVQAPIVNEYLRQTPIDRFKSNLATLLEQLSLHRNSEGSRRMDVLLFTTLGDKSISFEGGASEPIPYEDYFRAVKEFASQYGCGFVDFERYFRDCVASGLLDYEFLFDDPIHPGPYVNEFVKRKLAEIVDLLM